MSLTVACLCADWCNTCQAYRDTFQALAEKRVHDRFIWLDIEDHDDLVGELDIDNFPTLMLLSSHGQLLFAGTVTPHAEALERLCQAASAGGLGAQRVDAAWQPLVDHLCKP